MNDSYIDVGNTYRLPRTESEQIPTDVEAVNIQLKLYVTDSNTAKTASEVACLKRASEGTSVKFRDVLRSEIVRSENAFPEECTEKYLSMIY